MFLPFGKRRIYKQRKDSQVLKESSFTEILDIIIAWSDGACQQRSRQIFSPD
jgi:hypothetical protein